VLKVVEKEYSNTKKVAVHLHTFYVDLLEEFLNQFENFHFDYDLFLTTDTEAKKAEIESILEKNGKIAQVFLTGNRGRDIIP
ncbi:rhamnan synthesis F family protein, partial [Enterococcus gallinarum]